MCQQVGQGGKLLVFFQTMSFKSLRPRSLRTPMVGLLGFAVAVVMSVGLLFAPAAHATGFSDIASDPYHVQIEVLNQLGIIAGYLDGKFHPTDPVSRQQFAKMVDIAMRITVSENDLSTFADVAKSSGGNLYPDHYIAAAAKLGIVVGYTSGSKVYFHPYNSITLAQLVTMGTRAAGRGLFVPPSGYRSSWGNFDPKQGVIARVAQYNGLLRDLPLKSMSPWRAATRSEAAAFLFNVMGTDPDGLNGRYLGDSTDLVRYFLSKHPEGGDFTVSLQDLAKSYVVIGDRFGIRADMAWAQMIHETGFGEYGGVVLPGQNNFAGIGATGPGVPGYSFNSAELGVIAQFAHLAWYTYPQHLDDPACKLVSVPLATVIDTPGDPRHLVLNGKVHQGTVRKVSDLDGKWAVPGNGYGAAIKAITVDITQNFFTAGW